MSEKILEDYYKESLNRFRVLEEKVEKQRNLNNDFADIIIKLREDLGYLEENVIHNKWGKEVEK